jgi:hypothetical protein
MVVELDLVLQIPVNYGANRSCPVLFLFFKKKKKRKNVNMLAKKFFVVVQVEKKFVCS